MNRIRTLAEIVGYVTLGLLALYGLLALCGVAGPSRIAVLADANAAAMAEEAAIVGGTIPQTMNYQGFLRNPDGTLATGSYTITARVWNTITHNLGDMIYETTVPNVTVRDGLFNIVLGDAPSLPDNAFSVPQRYIGISLNEGPELIPRQRLHAVPWAMASTTLVDNAPAQSVQGLSSSSNITLASGSDLILEGGDIDVTGNLAVTEGLSVSGGLTVDPKPVLIKRFENLGNNAEEDTGISADEYECVATGWAAHFDFQEAAIADNMVWTYVDPSISTWFVHVEFSSHVDDEDPDVDILCFRKEITEWQGADRTLNDPD